MVKKPSKDMKSKKKSIVTNDKAQLAKKLKIELLRYCMVWCYNDKQTVAYFAERGVELSIPYYYELKRDYLSDEATKGWYHEQAISAMETTHKQGVEQLDALINITMIEIQQLQSTPVYIKVGETVEFNENHDAMALAKMMDTLTKLIATRDDMLAATPVVQAIMNKHAEHQAKAMVTK